MGRATIHTPETDQGSPKGRIIFPGTWIDDMGRDAACTGWIKFKSNPGSALSLIFERLGWNLPGAREKVQKFDGELEGGHFILSAKGRLVEADVDIEFSMITGFELHRIEVEGKTIRQLRFSGTYHCRDGAANIESYMVNTANAPGDLMVTYQVNGSVQAKLPGMATQEQREAVTN